MIIYIKKRIYDGSLWSDYSILVGHSFRIALNNIKLDAIAKITIKTITIRFPWMKYSIPLRAIMKEMKLFKK